MQKQQIAGAAVCLFTLVCLSGCVERRLTLQTTPKGAVIMLNDEQIGESPVSTSFQWYGDYNIEISKPGYKTIRTHRELKAPWYDMFPFDFFAQILNPHHINDTYQWHFELTPLESKDRGKLLLKAVKLKKQLDQESNL